MYPNRDELVAKICARLAEGEPLAQICREDGMPGVTTVWEWSSADSKVSEAIARAREIGHDVIADDCMRIADDATGDFAPSKDGEAFNPEHVQRSKLRIETRLKLLAKWNPKKYGDKQQVEHSGSLGIVEALTAARARSGV